MIAENRYCQFIKMGKKLALHILSKMKITTSDIGQQKKLLNEQNLINHPLKQNQTMGKEIKLTSKNLWEGYHNTESWSGVCKTHENLFRLGVESVMFRGGNLLNQFFSHKSDANKYLTADGKEELIKEFDEWCQKTVRE